ncbi:MAG: PqqD family peptide modification chaperone [archaeon]
MFLLKSPEVFWVKKGKDFELFNAKTKTIFRATKTAVDLVKLCNGKRRIEKIFELMQEKKDFNGSKKDLTEFISLLKEKNILGEKSGA